MKKRCLIFDFDGTLTDSYQLENHAMAEAIRRFADPKFKDFEVLKYYGPTEDGIVRKLVPEDRADEAVAFLNEFYDSYQREIKQKPFDGIKELLEDYQKRVDIYLLTGRSLKTLELSLDYFGFRSYFKGLYTGSLTGINKADNILKLCLDHQFDKRDVVYVGDTLEDIRSMSIAGVDIISAGYSHSKSYQDELERNNPNMVVKSVSELRGVIEKLVD